MRYLDASIPLCVLTEEPADKLDQCVEIMEEVERGERRVVTNVLTIAEIAHILVQREKKALDKVRGSIFALLDCGGLNVVDVDSSFCKDAIELVVKYAIDFVDAYNYLTMKKHGITEIYSLDEHYEKMQDIVRLES